MDPKDFDNILKQKLESLSDQAAPLSDWSRMERELDVDSEKDQVFDEQVKRKLEQLSVSNYASSNWSMLYQLVNTRIQKKRAVLFSKATELVFLGLFFFAIGQLGWFDSYKPEVYFADSFEKVEREQLPKTFDESQQKIQDATATAASLTNLEETNLAYTEIKINNNDVFPSSLAITPTKRQNSLESEIARKSVKSIASLNTSNVAESLVRDMENFNFEQTDVVVSSIEKMGLNSFANSTIVAADPSLGLSFPLLPKDNKRKSRIFGEVGSDLAFASIESALRMTNSRNVIEPQEITNKLYPVAFLKAGVDFDKVTVNTGVEFQSISYAPNVSHLSGEVSGTITVTDIEELQYDIVSVPLNFAWKLFNYKTWDLNVNTGIVGNFITNTAYGISQEKVRGDRITAVAADDVDLSGLPPLPSGYFDDSTQEVNISNFFTSPKNFVQVRTGIQISKKISRNTSIIANMNYNYQLPSFKSANQDGINSYSVGLSVRRYFS